MLLDISINGESFEVDIADPFRYDLEDMCSQIERFATALGVDVAPADVKGLIPKMIRGIAGCEGGCPADAKGIASRGHAAFEIEYVEGGILTAQTQLGGGESLVVKMFPDF
jgi:hypothetical protein